MPMICKSPCPTPTPHPAHNLLQNTAQCGLFDLFQDAIEITGTFKHRKVTLMEEGFNPAVIKDALYFSDDTAKTYVPMTEDMYKAINDKTLKI